VVIIRAERPEDADAVRRVHELAFGRRAEADIVAGIRGACPDVVSLVAADAGIVVGHILFSPVAVECRTGTGMGLGPMAVFPGRHGQGIGSRLVRRGLVILREEGCPFVVVLGHPAYYPRFGFEPASRHGLWPQWEGIPDEAFMILVLDAAAMDGIAGEVRYRPEFGEAV
jgi:putative acetyltransferase